MAVVPFSSVVRGIAPVWSDYKLFTDVVHNAPISSGYQQLGPIYPDCDSIPFELLDRSYPVKESKSSTVAGYLSTPSSCYELSCQREYRHGPYRGYQLFPLARIWGEGFRFKSSTSHFLITMGGILVPWIFPVECSDVMLEFWVPCWFDGFVVRLPFVPLAPTPPPVVLVEVPVVGPQLLTASSIVLISNLGYYNSLESFMDYHSKDVFARPRPLMLKHQVTNFSTFLGSIVYHFIRPPNFKMFSVGFYDTLAKRWWASGMFPPPQSSLNVVRDPLRYPWPDIEVAVPAPVPVFMLQFFRNMGLRTFRFQTVSHVGPLLSGDVTTTPPVTRCMYCGCFHGSPSFDIPDPPLLDEDDLATESEGEDCALVLDSNGSYYSSEDEFADHPDRSDESIEE